MVSISPTYSAVDAVDQSAKSRRSMGSFDDLPAEVREAIKACDFLIDLNRMPAGFAWKKVKLVEKIQSIKTFQDAAEFDKWLLQVGLRRAR